MTGDDETPFEKILRAHEERKKRPQAPSDEDLSVRLKQLRADGKAKRAERERQRAEEAEKAAKRERMIAEAERNAAERKAGKGQLTALARTVAAKVSGAIRPRKKSSANKEDTYEKIRNFWTANSKRSAQDVADHFECSVSTVYRARNHDKKK